MTNSVAGRRSGGIRAGGKPAGLEFLVDIAQAVSDCEELCGCGHADPRTCFSTVKNRKSLFLQTHHSLLLQNPSKKPPIKLVIKHPPLPVQQPTTVEVSASPPPPPLPPAAIAPVSLPLPRQPSTARIHPLSITSAAFAAVPVGFAAEQEDFPLSLKARVSAAVGGEGVCALWSEFTLVIRKKLTPTDLNPHHSRLSIPGRKNSYGLAQLLTGEEKSDLLMMGRKLKLGFFLDPDLQIASPTEASCLGIWKNGKSKVFTLIGGGWRWVLKKKAEKMLDMENGDEIELWSFRTVDSGELCFVLVTADTRRGRRRRRAVEKELGVSGNDDYDQNPVEQGAAMGRIEYVSPMDNSSNSSTLTDDQEEEQ